MGRNHFCDRVLLLLLRDVSRCSTRGLNPPSLCLITGSGFHLTSCELTLSSITLGSIKLLLFLSKSTADRALHDCLTLGTALKRQPWVGELFPLLISIYRNNSFNLFLPLACSLSLSLWLYICFTFLCDYKRRKYRMRWYVMNINWVGGDIICSYQLTRSVHSEVFWMHIVTIDSSELW